MNRLSAFVRATLFATIMLCAALAMAAPGADIPRTRATTAPEVRALWVDGFNPGVRTREEAEQLVSNAKQAGFNTLFIQVRRRADALYTTSLEPAIEDFPIDPTFDPLQNIIELAHREGIEVHAWINAMTVWKNQAPPKSANHVFNLHGPAQTGRANWLTASPQGEFAFPVGYFLDPGHPDAMQHLVDVYTGVARKYAVDGVHFDYIRYPEVEGEKLPAGSPVGYNAVSLERFRRATGRTDTPAPGDPQWIEWRRQQVTQLVRRVYLEVKAINPRIKVSAATIAWGKPPVTEQDYPNSAPMQLVFQDWNGWLKQGFLDAAVPMNYARENDPKSRAFFDGWITWEKQHKYGRQLVVGVGSYLNTNDGTLAEVSRVRQPAGRATADGVSFFSYASLLRAEAAPNGSGTSIAALHTGQLAPFVAPASVPKANWLEQPDRGWLAGTVHDASGKAVDGAVIEVSRAGGIFRHKDLIVADGNGFFGTSGLKPGRYQATLRGSRARSVVEVMPGKVARVEVVTK
ncbi:MAG TPA: family 10 glycosylhydrolase [Terriglobales bacterium]|nr:family 10 glycosylhydrolase [Terriglobales bacterium]